MTEPTEPTEPTEHVQARDSVRVCVVVVAYEAAETIQRVLARLPAHISGAPFSILVSDDHSSDRTVELGREWAATAALEVEFLEQPVNLGYGGNQKSAYRWALDHGFDVAVLVHGDGQYPPEMSGDVAGPIVAGDADAVFGSRLIIEGGARAGHMPLVRLVANRTLSTYLNFASHADLSEWFSGFRAYRLSSLADIGFEAFPDGFDFDMAITLRLLRNGSRVTECAIPTHYGDEISRVPLIRTGLHALAHGARGFRRT